MWYCPFIRRNNWRENAHCSIQWIDVATGWSARRAVLGRSQLVMAGAFRCILGRMPFPV